jgi:hypothetical protein
MARAWRVLLDTAALPHPEWRDGMKRRFAIPLFLILSGLSLAAQTPAGAAPVFVITQDDSKISFYVKASVSLTGDFRKWDASFFQADR